MHLLSRSPKPCKSLHHVSQPFVPSCSHSHSSLVAHFLTHSYSLTHSLTHSLARSLARPLTHSLTHLLSCGHRQPVSCISGLACVACATLLAAVTLCMHQHAWIKMRQECSANIMTHSGSAPMHRHVKCACLPAWTMCMADAVTCS